MTEWLNNKETEQLYSGGAVVKHPPASVGDSREQGSVSGSGRSPGEGNGNPRQYSRLENLMDREAWCTTVHRATNSWTRPSDWVHMHACVHINTHTHTHTHTLLTEHQNTWNQNEQRNRQFNNKNVLLSIKDRTRQKVNKEVEDLYNA